MYIMLCIVALYINSTSKQKCTMGYKIASELTLVATQLSSNRTASCSGLEVLMNEACLSQVTIQSSQLSIISTDTD